MNNPQRNKKIEASLREECKILKELEPLLKLTPIYVTNREIFVGGVILEQHADILWIDSIGVEPNFRRQGIGKRLLQEALLFASQNKAKEMQLNTYFREAHNVFLTCGFEDVALIPNWKYGLTCYLMRKIL